MCRVIGLDDLLAAIVQGAISQEESLAAEPQILAMRLRQPIGDQRDAQSVLPELSEAELEEVSTGLRPGSPDNAPILGPSGLDGLVHATGHYRNGILLAPLTADAVAALLAGDAPPEAARAFAPARFAEARA